MSRRRQHRLDGNHKTMRELIEARGHLFVDCSQTNLGFDALVIAHGRAVPCEIKDGSLPPSKRKLTPHEVKVHRELLAHGVRVEVLMSEADLEVLGRTMRGNFYKEAE